MQMVSIEEKIDLDSDEEIPFSTSQGPVKVHPFDFETSHIVSHKPLSNIWILKRMRSAPLRSVYVVLIKAKINMLLPFGPLAILLHYVTGKHVRIAASLIDISASLQLNMKKYVKQLELMHHI